MNPKINTTKYEKIIEKVEIDDRENDRIDYAMEQYAPFNPIKKHLQEGDYIFTGYNGTKVCFEYKTADDFLTSINHQDNHLHNQVFHMIHEYDYNFVVIQAKDLMKTNTDRFYKSGVNVSLQEINGAISELSMVCSVLQVQTQFQAFDLMMRTAGKVIDDKPYLYKFGKKSPNTALNYLNSMHGLKNKAYDIVTTLDLRTKKDLDKLTLKKLMEVDGIGEITAKMILAELGE